MNKKILSISDAASILGVSDETLRNWEREGKLIPFNTSINLKNLAVSSTASACGEQSSSNESLGHAYHVWKSLVVGNIFENPELLDK